MMLLCAWGEGCGQEMDVLVPIVRKWMLQELINLEAEVKNINIVVVLLMIPPLQCAWYMFLSLLFCSYPAVREEKIKVENPL